MLENSSGLKANWTVPADLHIRCHTILHHLIALKPLDIQLDQYRVLQIPLPTGTSVLFHRHRQALAKQHHNLHRKAQVVLTLTGSLRPNSKLLILLTLMSEPVRRSLPSFQYII